MVLKVIITIVVMIICVALVVLIAKQESKTSGLGALSGSMGDSSDTYWGKNKGRSREGRLIKGTTICTIIFLAACLLLNSKLFQ